MYFVMGLEWINFEFDKLPEADTWLDDEYSDRIAFYQEENEHHLPKLQLDWKFGDPVYWLYGFYLKRDQEDLALEKVDFLLDFGNITTWLNNLGLDWKVYIVTDESY